ncbi:MAG: hypothetical protein U1F07_04730 [Rubrivivax sp.]
MLLLDPPGGVPRKRAAPPPAASLHTRPERQLRGRQGRGDRSERHRSVGCTPMSARERRSAPVSALERPQSTVGAAV